MFNDNVRILYWSCNIKKSKTPVIMSESNWNKRRSNHVHWCHLWRQHLDCDRSFLSFCLNQVPELFYLLGPFDTIYLYSKSHNCRIIHVSLSRSLYNCPTTLSLEKCAMLVYILDRKFLSYVHRNVNTWYSNLSDERTTINDLTSYSLFPAF